MPPDPTDPRPTAPDRTDPDARSAASGRGGLRGAGHGAGRGTGHGRGRGPLAALAALGALVLVAASLAACSPLTAFNALVPKDEAGPVARDIAYGAHPRQRLDVYAPPPGAATDPGGAPVVVFVHGGSWRTGDKAGYAWAGRALASRGFVAVLPNYRLGPEGRYPAMAEDAAAAIRWARSNAAAHGGDGSRLAASGHSAGAYNAAQAVLAPEFGLERGTVDALVVMSGPVDFLPLDTDSTIAAFGHVPPGELPATQPVRRAGEGSPPPTLVIHGTDDETVEPRHARALDAAVRAAGGRSDLRLYEGVDHRGVVLGLSRPFRGRVPTLDDVTAFLNEVL